ncbi:MAG TPA: DUF6597 domain-containing transcriptional factor, partial [Blastocatellia bacterium]
MTDTTGERANLPQYIEYSPSAGLIGLVECFWSRVSPEGAAEYSNDSHLVLPDGCIDIVFNCSDQQPKGGPSFPAGKSEQSLVVGTMTRPLSVSTAGRVHFVGVRFKPGRAHHFLGISAHEVTDISVDLEDIWGAEGGFIKESILDLSLPRRQIAHLQQEVSRRALCREVSDPRVEHLIEFIEHHRGAVSVEALASLAGLSRQHLARKFERYI